MSKGTDLVALAGRLNEGQCSLLIEMAVCMLRPIEQSVTIATDIATPRFVENFTNRLLIHHATNEEAFTKKSFEYAFKAGCIADGKQAEIVNSQTNPGADVIVNEIKFSLKTEGAADMHPDRLKISKLMEARWIRDCSSSVQFGQQTREKVSRHLREYERVLILRAFRGEGRFVRYELLEIPRHLLLAVENVRDSDFKPRTKHGTTSAPISLDGERLFTLRLDGSVEKITISNLKKSACITHAHWTVPAALPSAR